MSEKKKNWKSNLGNKKWGEHKHCVVCGIAIPITQDFCGEECSGKYNDVEKKKGKKGKWQIGLIFAVMIVVMFVLPSLG